MSEMCPSYQKTSIDALDSQHSAVGQGVRCERHGLRKKIRKLEKAVLKRQKKVAQAEGKKSNWDSVNHAAEFVLAFEGVDPGHDQQRPVGGTVSVHGYFTLYTDTCKIPCDTSGILMGPPIATG
jgi:hypothetical protein